VIRGLVRFVDERSGTAPFLKKALRYVFPDNWSFLLGEVALYSFVILVGTGIYLTLFFEPSTASTYYTGNYAPLHGHEMSVAYRSAVDLSFKVRAGLLMRQTHHWAADVFIAAMKMFAAQWCVCRIRSPAFQRYEMSTVERNASVISVPRSGAYEPW